MKSIAFGALAFLALLSSAASVLPKQQAGCSALEWIWDTFVGGIGCKAP
nr:hypothetical protein [Sphingomonas psychrotolerans]